MKKLFLSACMLLISTIVFAQSGKMAVGVNFNVGLHSDYKNFGPGAKFQYEFIENFRAEASGGYYLKKDECTMWDANLNVHYLFHVGNKFNVYPLAGVTVLGAKVDVPEIKAPSINIGGHSFGGETVGGGSSSDTKIGGNIGAGAEYYITDNFKVNVEAKYQYVKDWDRPVVSVGAAYVF